MKKMATALIGAALLLTAPAGAATLVLYDYSPAFPDPATDAYAEQRAERQIQQGVLRPLRAPIADNGTPLTTKVQLFGGGTPYSKPGTQIEMGAVYWMVTTGLDKPGTLHWQVEVYTESAYVGGFLPPSDERSSSQVVSGHADMNDVPVVKSTYVQGGKTHLLIGFVEDQ